VYRDHAPYADMDSSYLTQARPANVPDRRCFFHLRRGSGNFIIHFIRVVSTDGVESYRMSTLCEISLIYFTERIGNLMLRTLRIFLSLLSRNTYVIHKIEKP